MIPNINLLKNEIKEVQMPTKTYKIEVRTDDLEDRIKGNVDDLNAVKQAIYLILNTERYEHIIYSWNYGVELLDLFGKPMSFVMAELPRRIEDALKQDDRIKEVSEFEFEVKGRELHCTFVVETEIGNIPSEVEVAI
jgi:hypothetical protein